MPSSQLMHVLKHYWLKHSYSYIWWWLHVNHDHAHPAPHAALLAAGFTCSSSSCLDATGDGAPVKAHCAAAVLGKAITSLMDGTPASNMASRSKPRAMPP
mmetsp:Transcript_40268/g.89427  ORF Transcript_40268/g.89427 Transcript_40268/m.89427 type:complete len:100 (+) Transcript_40268:279-578(+)